MQSRDLLVQGRDLLVQRRVLKDPSQLVLHFRLGLEFFAAGKNAFGV